MNTGGLGAIEMQREREKTVTYAMRNKEKGSPMVVRTEQVGYTNHNRLKESDYSKGLAVIRKRDIPRDKNDVKRRTGGHGENPG